MDTMTYVGMDVHLKTIAAVWQQPKGERRAVTVENSLGGLKKLVQVIGKASVWGCYEASSCGWEVRDCLSRMGWKMSVVAPTHIKRSQKGRKRKTDLEDAKDLLEVLMGHGELGHNLPAVWVPPVTLREHRELIRRRLKVGESAGRLKTGIGALLRTHGIKKPEGIKCLWTKKHKKWLGDLCKQANGVGASIQVALASQLRELEFHQEEIQRMDQEVMKLSEAPEYAAKVKKMMTRKGVGTLTAITFLVELGDPHRFSNRRKLASYLGLVPTSHESGEASDRKGHITRMGPPRVRKILNQAAWAALRTDVVWKRRYTRIAYRRKPKKALVATMRLLGIELWNLAKSA